MEDKELYDFFKSRKQSFDEAPGDDLWAKIEDGLEETPQAPATKTGLSVFKKLLILPVLGAAIALIWIIAYDHEAGEVKAKPQDTDAVSHEESAKITKDAKEYVATDTIKNVKLPVASTDNNPVPIYKSPAVYPQPALSGDKLKLKVDPAVLKPETIAFKGNLAPKDSVASKQIKPVTTSINPGFIGFKKDSVKIAAESEPQLEIISVNHTDISPGTSNEALIIPTDSLRYDLTFIKTETKTEPGRVDITVQQKLTKAQFKSYTEKVKKEGRYKPGTIITIIAPGYKPFRYKIPKPVGELGP